MRINHQGKGRTLSVSLFFFGWVVVIVFSLFKLQVLDYTLYAAKVKAQSHVSEKLHLKRGTIYDRNGEILAISVKAKSAFLSTREDSAAALRVFRQVSTALALSDIQRNKIVERIQRGERFIWVKRKLLDEEYGRLLDLRFAESESGILNYLDEYRRVYPQRQTACHVLGGVGIDEQALAGIEKSLDDQIKGRGGEVQALVDARKKKFQLNLISQPLPGKSVTLTIDTTLQYLVEQELDKAVQSLGAKGGAVIALDAQDGSVLALASCPDYSPEEYSQTAPDILRNRAVSFLYDPGSTFKIVLASAVLENRVCSLSQRFNCFNGVFQVHDRTITDVHPYEWLSFSDVIIHSSNIGAAQMGTRLGARRFSAAIERFGFGHQTNIRLPGEESGIVNPPERWSEVSLAFLSDGYEISVTPLQMARAFNVLASGGFRMEPQILQGIEGGVLPRGEKTRILSPGVVSQLVPILCGVVERGTGQKAAIAGLRIAGKTGTAKKIRQGKYSDTYVSSFGGFFPAEAPRLTMFILIDEPAGMYYGGDVAAPLFKTIAEKMLAYLRLFPRSLEKKSIQL